MKKKNKLNEIRAIKMQTKCKIKIIPDVAHDEYTGAVRTGMIVLPSVAVVRVRGGIDGCCCQAGPGSTD